MADEECRDRPVERVLDAAAEAGAGVCGCHGGGLGIGVTRLRREGYLYYEDSMQD